MGLVIMAMAMVATVAGYGTVSHIRNARSRRELDEAIDSYYRAIDSANYRARLRKLEV